jgi:predicted PurR-regulated permease PerM
MARGDADGMLYGIDLNSVVELLNPDKYISDINVEKLTLIANGVYKFGTAIFDAILAIFSSVYMLLSRKSIVHSAGRLCAVFTTPKRVHSIYNYVKKICQIFYSYIYSSLIDALVVSVLCSIAFYIIGVDYALLFGFLMGISNLVPYFGAIVAGVGVSAFAAITDGWIIAIITAAVILVIQQLDANFIQPKIIGRHVGIQPLFTLIAITIGGGVAGILGIILGVPIAATIHMFITDLIEWHEKKSAKKASDSAESVE